MECNSLLTFFVFVLGIFQMFLSFFWFLIVSFECLIFFGVEKDLPNRLLVPFHFFLCGEQCF